MLSSADRQMGVFHLGGKPSRKLRKRSRNVKSAAKKRPNARGHAGAAFGKVICPGIEVHPRQIEPVDLLRVSVCAAFTEHAIRNTQYGHRATGHHFRPSSPSNSLIISPLSISMTKAWLFLRTTVRTEST
jgi:hypothetical protein